MALYRGVISNYALRELHLDATQYGLLDGIREIPGLLTVLFAVVTTRLREEYALATWALILGVGLWLHPWAGSYGQLIVVTTLFSAGLHLWFISRDVLLMEVAEPSERALRLGQAASAWAAASIVGMGVASLVSRHIQMNWLFLLGGLLGVGAGVLSLLLRTPGRRVRSLRPLVWRWQYRTLYILTTLVAAREMITLTLATYLLVEVHQFGVDKMAMLFTVQGLLSIMLKPLAGKVMDRLGDRKSLVWNFALVIGLFLGYILTINPLVLATIYVVDNMLVGLSDIALSAYTARIVPQKELGPTLSLCSTLAHAVAVPLPVVGALLLHYDVAFPFLLGIVITAVALVYSGRLGKPRHVPNQVHS